MRAVLIADGRTIEVGGTSLICHNPRLQDELDQFKIAIGQLTSKRRKSLVDHQDIAQLEFLGGLYTDPAIEPGIISANGKAPIVVVGVPAMNVLRCLQEGAKRIKRGPDVLRGVRLLEQFCPLIYDGPKQPMDLYRDGSFTLRKDVGVGQRRVTRTRPEFGDWQLQLNVEVDPEIWNLRDLAQPWDLAGRYCGLGDMRPIHGTFRGTIEEA